MDKNTIIGIVIIFGLFMGWTWYSSPSEEEIKREQQRRDSIALAEEQRVNEMLRTAQQAEQTAETQNAVTQLEQEQEISTSQVEQINHDRFGVFGISATGDDDVYTIENDLLAIKIQQKGGYIYDIKLKEFSSYDSIPTHLIDSLTSGYNLEFFSNNRIINTKDLFFKPVFYHNTPDENGHMSIRDAQDSLQFGMRLYTADSAYGLNNSYIEFRYTLRKDSYLTGFDIVFNHTDNFIASNAGFLNFHWTADLTRQEQNIDYERQLSTIYYRFANEEVDYLSETKDDQEIINERLKWIAYKSRFFNTTLIGEQPFENAEMKTSVDEYKAEQNSHYLQSMESFIGLPYRAQPQHEIKMSFFTGPVSYPLLDAYHLDLERMVPIGWGFIPLAWINMLVIKVFQMLSTFGLNYGIIILIMAFMVKTILFPIAYKSYSSSAKMRVLKPEIEEINEKFPKKEDAMKKQQATMALYKKVGVSPLSGCLPMLLQMPLLIAMFRFFPSSIELRQKSFLWAHDLSSYDSIWNLPFNIPFYGDHVSLFTLLMTISTVFYTKLNSGMMGQQSSSMPGMKMMMYFMPIMFLPIFNNYAAALSYYYLLVNVITFIQMYIFNKTTDEKAIRVKLMANKKKPVKVSNWQKRMNDMMKDQQKKTKK